MKRAESSYPLDWLRIAGKELQRAERLLMLNDLEGAAFNIQQAAEKYLKAFLLFHGWKLRRIHDLTVLLDEAIHLDTTFASFLTEIQKITEYYISNRYPMIVESDYSFNELANSLQTVQRMAARITHVLEE